MSPFASHLAALILTASVAAAQTADPGAEPDLPGDLANAAFTLIDTNHPFYAIASNVTAWTSFGQDPFDNQLFQVRFEKYLNAPAATGEDDVQYRRIVEGMMEILAPHRVGAQRVNSAFRLLPRASNYNIDANLCDGIANSVFAVWQAQRNQLRLGKAQEAMEEERERLEWNRKMESRSNSLRTNNAASYEARMQPFVQRLSEVNGMLLQNAAKRELTELQTKLEFQGFIVQLFFQRRFQHVLISTRFYRHLFGDGDTSLKLNGAAENFFSQGTGLPPTVTTLDNLANEMIRDVEEGVEAYRFLLEQDELAAATRQLAQAYALGQHLPPVRILEREQKRRVLTFTQAAGGLRSAMKTRDFDEAEARTRELSDLAADFDMAGPLALIRTAKTASNLHLAKARNAAAQGDFEGLEAGLEKATKIWPLNPDLTNLAAEVFSASDRRRQALLDLDRLLREKNYRQILNEQFKYVAAVAGDEEQQQKLGEALQEIQAIEGAILRSEEFSKRGDRAGAWENAELAYRSYPDDTRLNALRADLTADAADFAQVIRRAQTLEDKQEDASGLAWYLKAQRMYPPSELARAGIDRLVARILPASTPEPAETSEPADAPTEPVP